MSDLRARTAGASASIFGLLGELALADAGFAGTGRLLSGWMSQAPATDDEPTPGEWPEAVASVDPILTPLAASGHRAAEIGEVVGGEPELRIL